MHRLPVQNIPEISNPTHWMKENRGKAGVCASTLQLMLGFPSSRRDRVSKLKAGRQAALVRSQEQTCQELSVVVALGNSSAPKVSHRPKARKRSGRPGRQILAATHLLQMTTDRIRKGAHQTFFQLRRMPTVDGTIRGAVLLAQGTPADARDCGTNSARLGDSVQTVVESSHMLTPTRCPVTHLLTNRYTLSRVVSRRGGGEWFGELDKGQAERDTRPEHQPCSRHIELGGAPPSVCRRCNGV